MTGRLDLGRPVVRHAVRGAIFGTLIGAGVALQLITLSFVPFAHHRVP